MLNKGRDTAVKKVSFGCILGLSTTKARTISSQTFRGAVCPQTIYRRSDLEIKVDRAVHSWSRDFEYRGKFRGKWKNGHPQL